MSFELGRLLITAGAVSQAEVEAALLLSVLRGISFPRALVDRGAISERALEDELDRRGGLALRQVVGSRELFARLPRAMCRRLAAVPTRHDPSSGAVDVAAADPLDSHVPAEIGFHLGLPVRILRAPIFVVEEAIRALELDDREPPAARARFRRVTPAFPHGAPQSTIPPPPSDDMPIPLVRRASHAGEEPREPVRTGRDAFPTPPELPGEAAPASAPRTARAGGIEPARGRPGARPAALREPSAPPPAVSFPSSPPLGFSAGAEGAALRPPPLPDGLAVGAPGRPAADAPARADQLPDTLRHGRLHMGRPAIAIDIPPARDDGPQPGPVAVAAAPGPAEGAPPAAEAPSPVPAEDPPLPPVADLTEVLEALHAARARDEIVHVVLRGLELIGRRAAVFAVKRGAFQGHACNPAFGDEAALRELALPMNQPSLLATATATSIYLGPVPGTLAHAPLLDVMTSPSLDVAAVAVRVAGRPVMVLVADQLGDTLRGTRSMDVLARAAGDALTRILAARL